jgi:predicted nucleotidyltransferase
MAKSRRRSLAPQAILSTLKSQRAALARCHVKRIGLFGSHAAGKPTATSDIDLLVEFEQPSLENFHRLTMHLERLFGRKVDILTLEGLRSIRVKAVARQIRRSVRYVEAD